MGDLTTIEMTDTTFKVTGNKAHPVVAAVQNHWCNDLNGQRVIGNSGICDTWFDPGHIPMRPTTVTITENVGESE